MLVEEIVLNEIKFRNAFALGALGAAAIVGPNVYNNLKNNNVTSASHQVSSTQNIQIPKFDFPVAKSEIKHDTISNPKMIKADFIKKVKPLIDRENLVLKKDREFLLTLPDHMNSAEKSKYNHLCHQFKTDNYDDLLKRVDVIPEELALAQAALESGWGTSNFAVDDHSLFGQRANNDSMNFADFSSMKQSIAAYMHNLNTNPAYDKFRQERYYMRTHGDKLNSTLLAKTLTAYDATGVPYTKKVQTIINQIPKDIQLADIKYNRNA